MEHCAFCDIAARPGQSVVAWETPHLLAFADHRPIRAGHVQIIPRAHYEVFDQLPAGLVTEIVMLGQRIARAQKRLYRVGRVGFAFTGNEVAHVHAHVVPLHAADDITSGRYADGTASHISAMIQARTARTLRQALEDDV